MWTLLFKKCIALKNITTFLGKISLCFFFLNLFRFWGSVLVNQIQPTVHSWARSVTVAVGIVSVVLLAHIDRFSLFRIHDFKINLGNVVFFILIFLLLPVFFLRGGGSP